MKRRINIQVRDGTELATAMMAVSRVIENGRVSEAAGVKCFCWHTSFNDGLQVHVLRPDKRRPNVDSFVVYEQEKR